MRAALLALLFLAPPQETADAYYEFKKGACWVYESSGKERKGRVIISVVKEEASKVLVNLAPKVGMVKLEVMGEFTAVLKEITERKDVKEPPPDVSRNERNAGAWLKTLATAQADFRANDRDGNRVNDFWTGDVSGLWRIKGSGDALIKLVELAVAEADAAPIHLDFMAKHTVEKPKPAHGYLFKAMEKDEEGNAYAQDADKSGKKCRNTSRFGFCACPAEYPRTGKRTFIVSEYGQVYWKDTGGKTVEQWPGDDALAKEWKTLD